MIRPFQLGDIFLIQRLGRQSTKLNTIQSLLQPQSAFWASLTTVIPWNDAKVKTYVLRQPQHGLAGMGFLQLQKRPGRPEMDIVRLAPGLDTPKGHPSIWEKLLSHYIHEETEPSIARLYVDLPDQPLPIQIFEQAGFRGYARQTIWRLSPKAIHDYSAQITARFRPQSHSDEWALRRLYERTVPKSVQMADGLHTGDKLKPPILDWWRHGICHSYLLIQQEEIAGSIQVAQGERGYWLQIWADMNNPDTEIVHQLLYYGLTAIFRRAHHRRSLLAGPVYIGVEDYHGGLSAVLAHHGFAPFTDRAKMVKYVVQWVRDVARRSVPALEASGRIIAAPFTLPEQTFPLPTSQQTTAHATQRFLPTGPAFPPITGRALAMDESIEDAIGNRLGSAFCPLATQKELAL